MIEPEDFVTEKCGDRWTVSDRDGVTRANVYDEDFLILIRRKLFGTSPNNSLVGPEGQPKNGRGDFANEVDKTWLKSKS